MSYLPSLDSMKSYVSTLLWGASEPSGKKEEEKKPDYSTLLTRSYPIMVAEASHGAFETHEGLEAAVNLAKIFFAAFAAATVAAYAFSFKPLILGVGAAGAIASAVYGYVKYVQIAPVEFWKTGFEMLQTGKVNEAIDHFKEALKEGHEALDGAEKFLDTHKNGFYYYDPRSKTPGSKGMIVPTFGNLLLHRAIHVMQAGEEVSDEAYATLQKDIETATKLFEAQRCGIRDQQKAICALFQLGKVEAQKALADAKIPCPKTFSVGHGILMNIYAWLHECEARLKEDGSMDGGGAGLEHLDRWQAAAEKAKTWLEKSNDYQEDSVEKKVVEDILAATNMRELMNVILGDFKTNLTHFEEKAASVA